MIRVAPSPKHPRGGYAELRLDGASLGGDATEVAIFDRYSERYLGQNGWQATKVLFGPYDVTRDGADAVVVIGPEVVNQIDEFANLRLEVGGTSGEVSWPDDIVPLPGAPGIGGIMPSGAVAPKPKSSLTAQMPVAPPEPEVEPEPEPEPLPPVTEEVEEDLEEFEDETDFEDTTGRGRKRLMTLMLLLIAALIGAAVAAWYWTQEETPIVPPLPDVVTPLPPIEITDDSCTFAKLNAISGFANQQAALTRCGGQVSQDDALTLLERGVDASDPSALMMFGMIYDDAATDPTLEESIGLTFNDNPARAADYYARARDAGSAEAVDQLARLCERMANMNDTLTQSAFDDHCGS